MSGLRFWQGGAVLAAILIASSALAAPAAPQTGPRRDGDLSRPGRLAPTDLDRWIDAAARRFAIPAAWIHAVIAVESAYDPRALSAAGAQGLMQLMPATYAELRARHRLGPDVFAPRDNILAGAAYLRQLHDRFGPEGMLLAYNAGPTRYAAHLRDGRPLPAETQIYARSVRRLLGWEPSTDAPAVASRTSPQPLPPPQAQSQARSQPHSRAEADDPLASPLFVRRGAIPSAKTASAPEPAGSAEGGPQTIRGAW